MRLWDPTTTDSIVASSSAKKRKHRCVRQLSREMNTGMLKGKPVDTETLELKKKVSIFTFVSICNKHH